MGVKIIRLNQADKWLFLIYTLSILLLVGLTFVFGPWHHIDTHGYIQAARHYADFDFLKGVNGYWSPLYSWILVPLSFIPIEPVWHARVINFLSATVVITGLAWMTRTSLTKQKNLLSGFAVIVAYLSVATILIVWSVSWLTPDFMSGVIALGVVYLSSRLISQPSIKLGVWLGLALTLLVFSKSIGIIFTGGVLAVVAIHVFVRKDRPALKPLIISAGILLLAILLWSTVIYVKYGVFAFSTSGQHNLNLAGPESNHRHQIDTPNKILVPQYDSSSSAWDDPTFLPLPTWSIEKNVPHLVGSSWQNTKTALVLFATTPIMILAIFLVVRGRGVKRYLIITPSALVLLAYIPMLVEERYMYMLWIPILAIATITSFESGRKTLYIFTIVAVLSASIAAYDVARRSTSFVYTWNSYTAQQAAKGVIPKGSTAAVRTIDMMYYCMSLEVRCLSVNYKIDHGGSRVELQMKELRTNGIQYYISRSPVSDSIKPYWSFTSGRSTKAPASLFIYKIVGE